MSSPFPILADNSSKKKRRPSFRPSSTHRKVSAKNISSADRTPGDDDSSTNHDKNANQDGSSEPTFLESSASESRYQQQQQQEQCIEGTECSTTLPGRGDGDEPWSSPMTKSKPKARKRKTTVLSVGASRGPALSNALVVASFAPHRTENDERYNQEYSTTTIVATTATSPSTAFESAAFLQETSSPPIRPHMPLESIPPIIPPNTTGKPSLVSYCSAFPKPKKLRQGKTAAAAPTGEIPVVVAEADLADAATAQYHPNHSQQQQHAGPVVQIVNGEIVLQESSMVFQGTGANDGTMNVAAAGAEDAMMTVVEEENEMAIVGATYNSFATGRRLKPRTQHWSVPETQLFYEALRQVGVDFGTMEAYFEAASADNTEIRKRQRRQLKRKYHAESIKNPQLVEKALQREGRVEIDLSVFQLTEESIKEMMEAEKEKEQLTGTSGESTEVVNDDGADSDIVPAVAVVTRMADAAAGAAVTQTTADKDFSWPEEKDAIANDDNDNQGDETEAFTYDAFNDPIFLEDGDTTTVPAAGGGGVEAPPTLALVHGVPTKASQKKKPNFRSVRKKTAKAK